MKINLGRGFSFCADGCRLGFMSLKGGYKAWWIIYAVGWKSLPRGEWKKVWCFPHFRFVDVNRVVEKMRRDDETYKD